MNNNCDDGTGSQDLFSSQQTSEGTNINEQIDITLQLTEFIWVQCDHPNCQKWRRVPVTNADDLGDDPWYCSMNPDPTMNSCIAKEEDHRRYDRMAKKVGIKFVMSTLNPGALVWAKTTGYCRWPGIVSPDPMTGVHIHLDVDGDPHSYHVEYLGNPHTHSWVTANYVEVYGHKDDSKPTTDDYSKRGRKKIYKKQKGGDYGGSQSKSKRRTSYKNMHVEDVMREADYLLDMTCDERMKFCVFKYDPKRLAAFGFYENESSTEKRQQKRCTNCGENPLRRKKRKYERTHESTQGICNLIGDSHAAKTLREKKKNLNAERRIEKNIVNENSLCSPAREISMVELTAGAKINADAAGQVTESPNQYSQSKLKISSSMINKTSCYYSDAAGQVTESPNQFSQSKLKISSSMINKTKEEKFKIDIDVYMKNEKAFEHDVRRFMTRNGRSIRTTPFWHNVPVSLFQLFLAVHERGGFQRVCESKSWTRVYKELTDMQNVTTGSVAKHFYERNLYPYELYISGQDYQAAVDKFISTKPGPKKKKAESNNIPATDVNNNSAENVTSDYASYCSDIEAILGQLEEDYKATISDDDSGKKEMKKKLGVGLTFHDESPSTPSLKFATVPSEFDQKASELVSSSSAPEQQVPNASTSGKDDDDLNLDDVEDKILTEMKALEDQMREMSEEIDTLI